MKWILILSLGFLTFLGCTPKKSSTLTIAVASNSRWVMEEIIESFRSDHETDCNLVTASSGKLTAQIMEGAPFDVFLSADMDYPNWLFEQGLVDHSPKVYARGSLVLWSITESLPPLMDSLLSKNVKSIAIANPRNAPYGRAALQVLNNYEVQVSSKLVYGENVSQATQFLISGAADLVFTSKSIVFSQEFRDLGHWKEIDPKLYDPLEQGAILISEDSEDARIFFDYLFSEKSRVIFKKHGYLTQQRIE